MAPGRTELIDIPVPEPQPGEVLIRVSQVNTCPQWDLHLDAGEPMFVGHVPEYPYTPGQPGHEMVGVVAALGAGVEAFRVGQRVAAWRDAGHHRQGCYAEYVCHDADHVLAVPDGVDDMAVCSLELAMCLGVSMLPLKTLDAVAGRRAAVCGLGPAGLVAAQMLRAEGATHVTGIETNAGRRDHALSFAVDEALDPRAPDIDERFPRRGAGVDVSIDCVGYPNATRFIMDHTNRHVALFAVQRHDYTYALGHAGLTVIGYTPHHRAAAEYALSLIAAGKLDLRPLVSAEMPFERYAEGLALLREQKALKIAFHW